MNLQVYFYVEAILKKSHTKNSSSFSFSPPYSLVVIVTLTEFKAVLAKSTCLWFTINQRPTVYVVIMHKSYMEELSMS